MAETPQPEQVTALAEMMHGELVSIVETCDVGRYMAPGATIPIEYLTRTQGSLDDAHRTALEQVLSGNNPATDQKQGIHALIFGTGTLPTEADGSSSVRTNVGVVLLKRPGKTPGEPARLFVTHLPRDRRPAGRVA